MLANLIYKLFPEDEWEYDGLRIHRMLVEDIDKFNELNLLSDKDSLLFYKKMEKDIGSRYKYMNELTKLRFVQNYLSDNEKMFFSIKLGKEMIGFIYAIEYDRKYFINILIKEEYRKKGYGKNAINYLKELLFEDDEIICDSIVFDSEYENDEVGKFFIKCGFIKDRELYSSGKEYIFTKSMYHNLTIEYPKVSDKKSYEEYISTFKNKILRNYDYFSLLNKYDKFHKYVFLKQNNKIIGIGKYKVHKYYIYIEISPEYRGNGYIKLFLNELVTLMNDETNDNYHGLIFKIHWKNQKAIKMVSEVFGPHYEKLYIGNKIMFLVTLIYSDPLHMSFDEE